MKKRFFREVALDFSFELIDENVLDEELNNKFQETVEEAKKMVSIMFAITAFFLLTL